MTIPARVVRQDGHGSDEAARRMKALESLVSRYLSPEVLALIEPGTPEVVGGPGLPKRRQRPKRP